MEKSRRRLLLTLVGAVVVVIYLALLGYILWGDWPAATPTPTVAAGPTALIIELWDAYQSAHVAAAARAPDAQLVSAATHWQGVDEPSILTGSGTWSFLFYSAANRSVLDVTANLAAARVVEETEVWSAPSVLADGDWREGPRDALLVFLAYDGRAFLDQYPGAMVDLHLAKGEGGDPLWTIAAVDMDSQDVISLQIDAGTLEILAMTP